MASTISSSLELYAPIQSLPAEILVIIFILCLNSTPYPPNSTKDVAERHVPIIFASICQKWRAIACNASELWSTCWLSHNQPEMNSIFLSRAGKQRVLILDGGVLPDSLRDNRGAGYSKTTQFLHSIAPHLRQCHSIILCTEVFDLLRHEDVVIDEAPHLRVLRTDLTGVPPTLSASLPAWLQKVLDRAPNIQTLRLREVVEVQVLCKLKGLVDLQLGGFHSPWELLELLRHIPELQRIRATAPFSCTLSAPNDLEPVIHTNLSELECTFHTTAIADLVPFLNSLTLPSLQSFTCNSEFILGAGSATISFLDRSRCLLKELALWCYPPTTTEFLSVLRHNAVYSSLQTLTFSFGALTNQLVSFLIPNETTGVINLPQLRNLSFVDVDPRHVYSGMIPSMVIARAKKQDGNGNLKHFKYISRKISMEPGPCYHLCYKEDTKRLSNVFAEQVNPPTLQFY